jgi:hypothetical protein
MGAAIEQIKAARVLRRLHLTNGGIRVDDGGGVDDALGRFPRRSQGSTYRPVDMVMRSNPSRYRSSGCYSQKRLLTGKK